MAEHELTNIKAPEVNKYTDEFMFLEGVYTLSSGALPYFTTTMKVEAILENLKLVEEIEGYGFDWSIEELFQREIDWKRVQDELVNGYLRDPNKLKFFNALTVALLPVSSGLVQNDYGKPHEPPPRTYKDFNLTDIGDVQLQRSPSAPIGTIRWHKERIYAVAIDGQHRLAALRLYSEKGLSETAKDTSIPVILLVLDKDAGFGGTSSLILTIREIFTDLNKHARQVPAPRLILLDDLDINSICVRTLVSSRAGELSDERLPLAVIDWRSTTGKFDSGYFMTSVLNLDAIVRYCLRLPEVRDKLDDDAIEKLLDRLFSVLKLDSQTETEIDRQKQLAIHREEPFSFTEPMLKNIREAFDSQWRPHIVKVMKELKPYQTYLSTAKQVGVLEEPLLEYMTLPEDKRDDFIARLKEAESSFDPVVAIESPLEELQKTKRNKWPFFVIFQKGVLKNFFAVVGSGELLGLVDSSIASITKIWIQKMNMIFDNDEVLSYDREDKESIWRGICQTATGTIQYTEPAAERINAFLTVCLAAQESSVTIQSYVEGLMTEEGAGTPVLKRSFAVVQRSLASLGKSVLDKDDDESINNFVKEEVIRRLQKVSAKTGGLNAVKA